MQKHKFEEGFSLTQLYEYLENWIGLMRENAHLKETERLKNERQKILTDVCACIARLQEKPDLPEEAIAPPQSVIEQTTEKLNEIDCTKCKFYDKHCGGKCGYINCVCVDCIHRGNNPACNIGNSQIPTNHFKSAELDNGNGLPTRIY